MAEGKVLTYIDDLIIPAKNEEENLDKLQEVLELASKHGLTINWEKCSLLVRKVEFLGYVIENSTIKPSEDKIRTVMSFPRPLSKKDIQ